MVGRTPSGASDYTDAPGLVARCAGCDQVLATVVDASDRLILSLAGLSAIELRR